MCAWGSLCTAVLAMRHRCCVKNRVTARLLAQRVHARMQLADHAGQNRL